VAAEVIDVIAGSTFLPIHRMLRFDDGSGQTIEFGPVLAGELYGPLRDPELFGQVRLDPEVHTLVWPNGADFDPATLHDWPLFVDELSTRARAWAATPVVR
jgi:hypothetical protein